MLFVVKMLYQKKESGQGCMLFWQNVYHRLHRLLKISKGLSFLVPQTAVFSTNSFDLSSHIKVNKDSIILKN